MERIEDKHPGTDTRTFEQPIQSILFWDREEEQTMIYNFGDEGKFSPNVSERLSRAGASVAANQTEVTDNQSEGRRFSSVPSLHSELADDQRGDEQQSHNSFSQTDRILLPPKNLIINKSKHTHNYYCGVSGGVQVGDHNTYRQQMSCVSIFLRLSMILAVQSINQFTGVNPAGDAGDTSPQYFGWGTSTGIFPPILLRTFGYTGVADQYWLP